MYAVVFYTAGPRWKKGRPAREQELSEHASYQESLARDGRLKLGGPFASIAGGMSILSVDSLEEAQNLVDKDPAVTSKVMRALVQVWEPAYGEAFGESTP